MNNHLLFNKPPVAGKYNLYLDEVIRKNIKFSGDGPFNQKVQNWFEKQTGAKKVLTTSSCTHALEMAAILCNIEPGDEVIAPSYTFVSTVNAFVLRGAKIVFVDIRPDTMNINEKLIENAISEKTKAIVVVHYAGVACDMAYVSKVASKHNLLVIEDAAQGVMSTYKGKALGTLGDLGTYSFHETKNYSMGEGGALLINNGALVERAEIIREKGTDRSKFFRGQVDKYSWVDIGSSYLPSELAAAFLFAQLEVAEEINKYRLELWQMYYEELMELQSVKLVELPYIPADCQHNAHMFYIKLKNIDERAKLINFLKQHNIDTVFHYIPLHSSLAGRKYGTFNGADVFTTNESERLLRLPIHYEMAKNDLYRVTGLIKEYLLG